MSFEILQSRLGPKPFSTDAAEISFDKVFAVPTAPTTNEVDSNRQIAEEEEEVPAPTETEVAVPLEAAADKV
jgi:hypothetical protein